MIYRATNVEQVTGGLTELRVHGVGGTSPESLLGVPYTELVAGDRQAGFFRVPTWIPIAGPPRSLEGYSWGGITSRARLRALWLLLLPFALVNLAGWMFPHEGDATSAEQRAPNRIDAVNLVLLRTYGLMTTIVAVAAATFVSVDLIGRRCQGACLDSVLLGPWRWGGVDVPTAVMARGLTVATLAVLAVAWIAKRSQAVHHTGERNITTGDPAFRVNLTHRALWESDHVAHRLGLLHTAAAVATCGALTATLARAVLSGPELATLAIAQWLVVLGAAIGVSILRRVNGRGAWALLCVAGVLDVVTIVVLWSWRETTLDPGTMFPAVAWLWLLFGCNFLLLWLSALAPGLRGQARRLLGRSRGEADREPTLPVRIVVPFLGGLLAVAGSAALMLRIAALLGVTFNEHLVGVLAVVSVLWVLATCLLIGLSWLRALCPDADAVAHRYPDDNVAGDRAFTRRICRFERMARVPDAASTVVTVATLIVTLLIAALSVSDPARSTVDRFAQPASWIISLAPLAALAVFQAGFRDRDTRRRVGILWDVVAFWPRWFHPWAPPSYGEHAVPHLRRRLDALTAEGHVILSAHSQGAVVAVAALAGRVRRPRNITVLTHGCPLNRLYGRYFPEYVDQRLFATIAEAAGPQTGPAWVNLWRYTDPIGGPVTTGEFDLPLYADDVDTDVGEVTARLTDVRVWDPFSSQPRLRGDARPGPIGHSDYYATGTYADAIVLLSAGASAAPAGMQPVLPN